MFKIMLVDDEQHFIDEMEEILREKSLFHISARCFNGISALKIIRDLSPDVLITDVLMPEMNGLELSKRIKAIKPDLPVILMSENPSYAVDGFEIGVSGFLLKPLVKDRVIRTLTRLLCE